MMLCVQKGAAMNQYIGQQFADLRYEKNILVIEETTSGGRWGFFNAAFLWNCQEKCSHINSLNSISH